ncbi:MAG: hypothetical protein R3E83_24680 [Burkholderiaceae bacterium]
MMGALDTGATVAVSAGIRRAKPLSDIVARPGKAELAADVATPAPTGNYRIVRVDGTRTGHRPGGAESLKPKQQAGAPADLCPERKPIMTSGESKEP